MSTTSIQTFAHTHFSYCAQCQSANTEASLSESEPARAACEKVRISKTRERRRSAGGTGALANFLRHVCLSMCVLPAQAVLPCNCSITQPIIFTQLHFFPLRPSKYVEEELERKTERNRYRKKQRERERETYMQCYSVLYE